MNERIKQLAEQVGAVRNVLAMGRHDGVLFTEFELEKFAELIVRECADIVKETRWMIQPSQEQIARSIKQHFGVE
jgi:hypothetical protein